ncbi:MAG: hypothetical protein V3V48_12620 [Candidatus Aminicenantaceae bacterium]
MTQFTSKNSRIILITCFLILTFYAFIPYPYSAENTPQEEVTVIAAEIPVRVLHKGQFVRNLTREDFEIYENGILQPLTGFEIRSRRISLPVDASAEELKIQPENRLFLLIFNIFDYQDYVGEAVDYFFANTFRKGDRVIIVTEGNLFPIETGKGQAKVAQDVKDTLKKFKVISTMQILSAYQNLRSEADRLILALMEAGGRSIPWDQAVMTFYRNYERIWLEYKRQFITPDLELYRSMIKRIKAEEGEKWALCFQQREMFPKLKNEGRLERLIRDKVDTPSVDPMITIQQRNVRSMQMQLQRIFDVSGDMPTEALKNLFMEANITFHLLLLKSLRPLMERDFEYREVGSDYEDCFRQISFSTGGHTAFSNEVTEAMIEAFQTEDYYYLLVYSPKEDPTEKPLTIDVKVKQKGVDVIHLKRFLREKALPISIVHFDSGRNTIKFSLINYQRVKMEDKLSGVAQVKITLFDKDSKKVFEDTKVLQLIKDQTHISIPFNQLKSGSYFIIIQVVDRITNSVDVFSKQIKF